MAVWRSPELEAVIGGPLDAAGLTEVALQGLVSGQAHEGELLDFKRRSYSAARDSAAAWSPEQEFAKDVTAFANHRGGMLLIGVEDVGEVAVSYEAPVADPGTEEQRLRRALLNNASPPPRVEFVAIPSDEGGHYLAVVIPPSPAAPHATLGRPGDSRRPLHYFIRDGADVRPLTEGEVADRYRRRAAAALDRVARRERTAEEGREALRRGEGLWLYLTVVPEGPTPGVLDAAAVHDADQWWNSYQFWSPLQRRIEADGTVIPAPGRVTYTDRRSYSETTEPDPFVNYLELHVDGAAFAAKRFVRPESETGVGRRELADDTVLLADACLQWALRQAGSWGQADVTIGLVDAEAAPGQLTEPLTLTATVHDNQRRVPNTRRLLRTPSAVVSADLATAGSTQARLAVTHAALSALLHWFGVAQADELAADGTIITHRWEGNPSEIELWATNWNVASQLHPSLTGR